MHNNKNLILWVPLNILNFSNNNINSNKLNLYLDLIRKLDKTELDIKLGLWDFNLSYKKSKNKVTSHLDPSFYTERQVWNDFIFSINDYSKDIPFDPLSFQTFLNLNILLKLFWRDIVSKLNSKVRFKIQLTIKSTVEKKYRF